MENRVAIFISSPHQPITSKSMAGSFINERLFTFCSTNRLALSAPGGIQTRPIRFTICCRRNFLRSPTSVDSTLRVKVYWRSEEHTSELQSRFDLVCRLLLEKKK